VFSKGLDGLIGEFVVSLKGVWLHVQKHAETLGE